MNRLDRILKKRIVFLDGATGTNLLDKGLKPGESPSILNIRNPEPVYNLQKAYVDAGSDIILTNTFSANPLNFSVNKLKEVIIAGVKLAKKAAKNKAMVLGDVGPLGVLIKPYGEMEFDDAIKIYQNIFSIFYQTGIKVFLIETFTSIIDAKAASLAAKKFSEDIFVSFSLQDNGRTIMGEIPESIAVTFEALGAKGIGINCTIPEVAIEAISKMTKVTNLPLIIKPNAGKVEIIGNKIRHTISNREIARYFNDFVQAGADMVGGCCGTTSEYIKMIAKNVAAPFKQSTSVVAPFKQSTSVVAPFKQSTSVVAPFRVRAKNKINKRFILASPQKILEVTNNSSIIVGERLNPSGRKKIREGLIAKHYQIFGEEAKLQQNAGADALDINAFAIEIDEKVSLVNAIFEVLKSSQLPLFIDTQNFEAAKEVLSFYPGIGVYNSIPARKKELQNWLPMVKEYGFKAVISLVGKKIPRTYEERIKNVELTLAIAKKIGFERENLIFDALVFTAATEKDQISHTLRTVEKLHSMGLKTILGISNVSFGLPNRSWLNATLVNAAIKSGATFFILNPLDELVMNAVNGARTIWSRDFSPVKKKKNETKVSPPTSSLTGAIINGDDKASIELAQKLLSSGTSSQEVIDNYISKALKVVGDYYEKGKFFIPDLLKSAEASKAALGVIKKRLTKRPGDKETRRMEETEKWRKEGKKKVVLATVKGDIHDIGKNIAGMIFESAGYEIIDLGKDVSTNKIVETVRKHNPIALGLSALLTTTMPEMANVIIALRKAGLRTKVIIGGPNVSEEYAKKISAYGAARNVLEGLEILKRIKCK